MGLFNFTLFAREAKEAAFWAWFQNNDARLFAFEKDQDRVFGELSAALKKVHPDLTFEFGPVESGDRREFIISAGGIKNAFPAVEDLFASAPQMPNWAFLKFRQRRSPLHDLVFSEKRIAAKDVHYLLFKDENPAKVGVMLFFDGYNHADRALFGQMGFLFLDEALGEYDVEMKLGAVEFQGRDSKHFAQGHPLTELAKEFDDYFERRQQD